MAIKSILETIMASNFMADAAQVERLAGMTVEGDLADTTYFRVILAHMQSRLGRPARGRRARNGHSAEAVLNQVHEELYPAFLKGVGPADLPQDERNRRGTRARTAASTVRYFIQQGGDVRAVDVATATKSGLRRAVQPEASAAPEGETRVEKSFRLAQDALVRKAQRLMARGDPELARERIEAAMDALEALLESLPPAEQPQPDVGGTATTIVGRPSPGAGRGAPAGAMLHRPAG